VDDRIPILCLGSGAALNDGKQWGSLLIDNKILLDLPPTAIPQLHRSSADLTSIGHVFVSHLHADHMFGLPFLLLEYCVRRERPDPLYLIGPTRLQDTVEQLCALAWPDLNEQGFHPKVPLSYIEISEEGVYHAGELTFTAVPMQHFHLHAFGYRFQYKGRAFAYTGDTGQCAQLNRLLDGADVAIIELTHPRPTDDPGHMDVEEVARVSRKLTQDGAIVLATHMSETPQPVPGLILCQDGKTYWV
jgi:ribonuclease BN (tRNA processing enzyme)